MNRYILTAGIMACGSVSAFGQLANGTPVGIPLVQPVGTMQPQVGTRQPSIGMQNPSFKPITSTTTIQPQPPAGIDPKLVVSPFPSGMPATGDKGFWDKLYDRWALMFASDPKPVQNNWTPGLARRNRERKENRFVRD